MQKVRSLLLSSFIMFIVGCQDDELNFPLFINEQVDGSLSSFGTTDLMIDNRIVGTLTFAVENDSLEVLFFPKEGLYVKYLRYHISTSLDEIPLQDGNPDIAKFLYTENTQKIPLGNLSFPNDFDGKLYVSAYARLAYGEYISTQKTKAQIKKTHQIGDPSYFETTLTQPGKLPVKYFGYCLQGDQLIDTSVLHEVQLLSSTGFSPWLLDAVIDNEKNLDLVNWVLNQKRSRWIRGDSYAATGADIQMAIWKLVETTGNPTGRFIDSHFDTNTVTQIVKDAYRYGDGFRPVCGQKKLIILHKGPIEGPDELGHYNSGAYGSPHPNFQVGGVVKSIICSNDERDGWSKGRSFPGKKHGTYFGFKLGKTN